MKDVFLIHFDIITDFGLFLCRKMCMRLDAMFNYERIDNTFTLLGLFYTVDMLWKVLIPRVYAVGDSILSGDIPSYSANINSQNQSADIE